jgi:hypothetical protein
MGPSLLYDSTYRSQLTLGSEFKSVKEMTDEDKRAVLRPETGFIYHASGTLSQQEVRRRAKDSGGRGIFVRMVPDPGSPGDTVRTRSAGPVQIDVEGVLDSNHRTTAMGSHV